MSGIVLFLVVGLGTVLLIRQGLTPLKTLGEAAAGIRKLA